MRYYNIYWKCLRYCNIYVLMFEIYCNPTRCIHWLDQLQRGGWLDPKSGTWSNKWAHLVFHRASYFSIPTFSHIQYTTCGHIIFPTKFLICETVDSHPFEGNIIDERSYGVGPLTMARKFFFRALFTVVFDQSKNIFVKSIIKNIIAVKKAIVLRV